MTSDNGKAGKVDWYDVAGQIKYLEAHYQGTVQVNLSTTTQRPGSAMLLCSTFVGDEPGLGRYAGESYEVPCTPGAMLRLPELAHELLFHLQETIDDQPRGTLRITPPRQLK